jgi:hypothetical protein
MMKVNGDLHDFVAARYYKTSIFCRGLLEAGSVYKGKLEKIENNNRKIYSVLNEKGKRDEKYLATSSRGWIIYEE